MAALLNYEQLQTPENNAKMLFQRSAILGAYMIFWTSVSA